MHSCPRNFNPRTHEECDKGPTRQTKERKNFNPRTHEECDKHVDGRVGGSLNFNPRTHEECDQKTTAEAIGISISIHALTRSATRCRSSTHCKARLFQSTHSRGVRQMPHSGQIHCCHFNPRTHEECDGSSTGYADYYYQFQSTHSRGVRQANGAQRSARC